MKPSFKIHELFYSDQNSHLSVGIANINSVKADLASNQAKILSALESFSAQKVNMVVFPEYCLSAYFWESENECRPFMENTTLDCLAPWLDTLVQTFINDTLQYIVVNGLVKTKQDKIKFYNTTLVLDRDGYNLAPNRTYRKTFLPGLEKNYITSGVNDTLVLDTAYGKLGFLTCYDICFSQMASELVYSHQVEILVVTAAWRKQGERIYPGLGIQETTYYQFLWEKFLPSLAFQHQVWVVAANAVGSHSLEGLDYCGRSGIWAPSGINMIQGSDSDEELLILHNIALKEDIAAERESFCYLDDFRQIYRELKGFNTSTRSPVP